MPWTAEARRKAVEARRRSMNRTAVSAPSFNAARPALLQRPPRSSAAPRSAKGAELSRAALVTRWRAWFAAHRKGRK